MAAKSGLARTLRGERPRCMELMVRCPYCGEPVSLDVDEGGGRLQRYIEDCSVCCQPIDITATIDPRRPNALRVRPSRLDE